MIHYWLVIHYWSIGDTLLVNDMLSVGYYIISCNNMSANVSAFAISRGTVITAVKLSFVLNPSLFLGNEIRMACSDGK